MVLIEQALEARTAPTISKMAEFLGTSVDEVAQLVEERRIESAILATLRGRGVVVTPRVKNSVRMFVGSMEPQVSSSEGASAAGEGVQSDSTATIVFTDVVGSTSMIERLGDRLSRRVLMGHEKIIREQTAAHGGSVVKALGDGFMLAFRSARRALACAIGIQQALADFNTTQAANTVAVRIGLTVGEPVPEKEDLFGISVNMAARIAATAAGGQVLVSQVAYALASTSGDFNFRQVGEVELKGIAGNHLLYEVLWSENGAKVA